MIKNVVKKLHLTQNIKTSLNDIFSTASLLLQNFFCAENILTFSYGSNAVNHSGHKSEIMIKSMTTKYDNYKIIHSRTLIICEIYGKHSLQSMFLKTFLEDNVWICIYLDMEKP